MTRELVVARSGSRRTDHPPAMRRASGALADQASSAASSSHADTRTTRPGAGDGSTDGDSPAPVHSSAQRRPGTDPALGRDRIARTVSAGERSAR